MSQSLSKILVHIVFSTKKREDFLVASITSELYSYIAQICKDKDSPVKQIGGTENHIHILISLSRTITIAKLISDIKAYSSRWLKNSGEELAICVAKRLWRVFNQRIGICKLCELYKKTKTASCKIFF